MRGQESSLKAVQLSMQLRRECRLVCVLTERTPSREAGESMAIDGGRALLEGPGGSGGPAPLEQAGM